LTKAARGLLYGVLAYMMWGLFPLFWPLLEPASPLEILACRIVFSLLVVTMLLAARKQLGGLRRLDRHTLSRLCIAGVAIAVNWGAFIWGVNNAHVVETSLGYFINPLITIGLGVLVLRERLRGGQWLAVALGAVAVGILSFDYGRLPWLALLLAISFGTYGFIKKGTSASAPEGLFVEAAALTIPALVVLAVLATSGGATWIGPNATPAHLVLLAAAGPVTAVPLLFFAGAARRLPLTTLGLLQYLAPVLQFAIGVLIRHEPMPPARLGGFALVWIALAILTVDAFRHRRAVPNAVAELEVTDVVSARESVAT
jgi:chloramphenicol-sensitive protein RarD